MEIDCVPMREISMPAVEADFYVIEYVFKICIKDSDYHSIALSYDPESDITYGIVICQTYSPSLHYLYYTELALQSDELARRSLWSAFKGCTRLANHPLLVPVILATTLLKLNTKKAIQTAYPVSTHLGTLKRWRKGFNHFERDIESKIIPTERELQDSLEGSNMMIWGLKIHLDLIETLLRYLSNLRSTHLGHRLTPLPQVQDQNDNQQSSSPLLAQQSAYLEECLRNIQNNQRDVLLGTKFHKQFQLLQLSKLSAIREDYGNLLNRSIAEATKMDSATMKTLAEDAKRDSSSMKAIALLTMIFLPSTYVSVRSTLFHLPPTLP